MLEQMALSSRSTLNGYCNCLKIWPRTKVFTPQQVRDLMALRQWVQQGRAIAKFTLNSENRSDSV